MKPGLTLLFTFCYSCLVAQTDSSWINLGRIRLKKDFTQTVTIKGKDLVQMPFGTLDEALNMWLSGILTNKSSVVYVVDGSLLADVHAYSIHDIEEITLVQNAAVNLNGALQNQLVIITTKNRSASSGISVAGATYAVRSNLPNPVGGPELESPTNLFHRYYMSARKHTEKWQFGGSIGYLRDVYPYPKGKYDMDAPYQVNRFNFHAYLNATLDAHNDMWVRAGFVPAVLKAEAKRNEYSYINQHMKNRESLFTIEAGWNMRINERLTNEFSVGYAPSNVDGNSGYTSSSTFGTLINTASLEQKFTNLLLNDHLNYHHQRGDWSIDPAIDLSFRSVYSKIDNATATETNGGGLSGVIERQQVMFKNEYRVFLVTPSVNLSFKDFFNIQGGLVYNPSENKYAPKAERILPFVNTAFDVLKAFKANSNFSWKLFGSYASAGHFADYYYPLADLTPANGYTHPHPYSWTTNASFMPTYGGDTANHSWQAGSTVGIWKQRIQVSYNFANDKSAIRFTMPSPIPGYPSYFWGDVTTSTHRIGVTANILEGTRSSWLIGVNASSSKPKLDRPGGTSGGPSGLQPKRMWTGGLVNRFRWQQFTAGLDLLYFLDYPTPNGFAMDYDDALAIRNLYIGYQLPMKKRPLDLFMECRNPGQNGNSKLQDKREFYGLGFKTAL